MSLLRERVPGVRITPTRIEARGVTGQRLKILGEQEVSCSIWGKRLTHTFTIAQLNTPYDGLLGLDLLTKLDAVIHPASGKVELAERTVRALGTSVGQGATRGRDKREPGRGATAGGPPVPLQVGEIRALRNTSVPAYSEKMVEALVPEGSGSGLALVEPEEQPQTGLRVGRSLHQLGCKTVWVKVVNLTAGERVVDRRQVLGCMVRVEEVAIKDPSPKGSNSNPDPMKTIMDKLGHLSSREKAKLDQLLRRYGDVFEEPDERGCALPVQHKIITGDARPVTKRPYRVPHHQKAVIREHLDEMLRKRIITPSDSPWSAPVVLVPKKCGDGTTQYRFCTDFRGLNAVTKTDAYPLPLINETLERLGKSRYFTTLDLRSGYHQIPVDPADREKTAFTTEGGHFEYQRLPFGLVNAPATFQRLMDRLLFELKGEECFVYLDDIIIFSETFDEHCTRLGNVLERLRAANLKVNLEKCAFLQESVKYLGHIVTADGVKPDPEKVRAVEEYPVPRTVREVKGFLGLAGYYRRFIQGFAEMAKPLTALLKKEAMYVWGREQQNSFDQLKRSLCSAAVLIYPDFEDGFILSTDASGWAVGAVLSQVRNGQERPVAYASRQMNRAEQNYSATEKELLAVVWATKVFRCYLLGRPFRLVTDHAALQWMLSLVDPSSRLTRWALRLSEFKYTVEHKPGKKHTNADALSRARVCPVKEGGTGALSTGTLRDAQDRDEGVREMADKPGFCRDARGLVYKEVSENGRSLRLLVVPKELVPRILESCHATPWGGHPGIERTAGKVRLNYYWPTIQKDVEEYVRKCDSCAKRKSPGGLKVPLERPYMANEPMEQVSIDIVGPLPKSSRGNRFLLTIIDNFTRYAEAVPLVEQTAEATARALVEKFITRHGAPKRLLTDQGRNFISSLMKEICRLLRIKKIQTTAYHPEGNGMIERLHRTLNDSISHFVRRDGTDWDRWVPYALMAYRSIPHASTGLTPNYLMFGREILAPFECWTPAEVEDRGQTDQVAGLRDRLREAYRFAREQAEKSWAVRTKWCNRNRKRRDFEPGAWVYLHTPAVKPGRCAKFHCPWTGPHVVLGRTSRVNYRIRTSTGQEMVVHINRLKPAPEGDIESLEAGEPRKTGGIPLARSPRKGQAVLDTPSLSEESNEEDEGAVDNPEDASPAPSVTLLNNAQNEGEDTEGTLEGTQYEEEDMEETFGAPNGERSQGEEVAINSPDRHLRDECPVQRGTAAECTRPDCPLGGSFERVDDERSEDAGDNSAEASIAPSGAESNIELWQPPRGQRVFGERSPYLTRSKDRGAMYVEGRVLGSGDAGGVVRRWRTSQMIPDLALPPWLRKPAPVQPGRDGRSEDRPREEGWATSSDQKVTGGFFCCRGASRKGGWEPSRPRGKGCGIPKGRIVEDGWRKVEGCRGVECKPSGGGRRRDRPESGHH